MAIYEILASSTSEIQGITCFIIQLFIAEAMFFFHLKKRKRFWLRLLVGGTACLLLGVTLPIIIGQYISGIRTFIVLVFMQLYMWFCFRRSFLDILFCTIGAFTVQNLGSNIQVLICIVTKTSFKMLSTEMVIGFTIVYIICYLTCAAKIKNFPNISQNRVRVLWVAIISLCVCWLLQSWLISEKLDMVMACRVPFVFCCILSLFMQFGLLEQSRLNEENLALEQLIKENAKQYELSKKTVEIINMKCHDLKHRILELEQAGNADHGQLEEIRKAVDIYDGLAKTGCQPLDIILSEKNLLCEKYQIKFSYMIDGEKLTGIKSGDIAAIFGNALDNAIECAAELPVEKRIISLIGYARQDVMGIHIENYCEDELEFRNGLPVSTKGDDNYHGIHTTLAMVHTYPDGDRDFSFYRNPGADMMLNKAEICEDILKNTKIFHFGTLSMTHEGVREATKEAIHIAEEAGAIISFDPNLRPPLWESMEEARKQVLYGLGHCQILKISDNEIQWLTGEEDYSDGVNWIRERYQIPLILVSMGREGSRAYYNEMMVEVKPFLQDNTIETTGAGDTFCGCVLHYVCEHGINGLKEENLAEMLTFANAAASIITTRKGALRVMPEEKEIKLLI